MKELPKVYDPREVEGEIYRMWMDRNCFHAERDPDKKPFTIVIPPPNVTGQLHLGHAFDETIQDVLIRYKRMDGYSALWLPGYDHAGIATQIKVEEKLRNEGLTRFDLGRDKFLDEVWAWKDKYGDRIVTQLKTLGSSCDWERQRFTMDDTCARAVRETFCDLYEKGLIYKGKRIINWCPHCTTALSDAEVEYVEKDGSFWHIAYPLADGSGAIEIATTRPETLLGDAAVAVNPEDPRYKDLIGKTCILPLVGREIPIVADEHADMSFGTGAVKITPCHDPNDFEVGLRHNLPQYLMLDGEGKITGGYKWDGMDRYEARKAIVEELREQGYLLSIEPCRHNVGTCYRCHNDVEPLASDQWFVKMEPLAKEAVRVVEDGEVKFVPDRFTKIYLNWMNNVRDWCISRQLWWGHQIPAWYCADCGHVTVSRTDAVECEHCHSKNITRDPDVLDTWFSSALWPFSTLGWPDKTPDLEYFFPTDVLVTGYDIIFFWVARMIFSSCEQMKKPPFHTVLIHGLIRDPQGKKMSKSAGNGVDPIDMIDKYGADALRFNIITGNSPGNDMRFYVERCEAMRNFANKLWNASRFVMMNLTVTGDALPAGLELEDRWMLSKLNTLRREVRENLDKYELGIAAQKIYDFIWDTYCDWYIELTKSRLYGEDAAAKENAQRVLLYALKDILKLLHPFMPYITEEIWQALPHEGDVLMLEKYPVFDAALDYPEDETDFEMVMEAIRAVRARRSEMNVPPSRKAHLIIVTDRAAAFENGRDYICKLAYAESVAVSAAAPERVDGMVSVVTDNARMFMPMAELVDIEKEKARIARELENARQQLAAQIGKLANENFVARAPEAVVNTEREKKARLEALIENLTLSLKNLG
ncbi:MAG TPA: valine--tRNA ligase [Oscillospiraceae bacterium]|nr:valine--tRNA ligase [Oscillospiraceae bacterium]